MHLPLFVPYPPPTYTRSVQGNDLGAPSGGRTRILSVKGRVLYRVSFWSIFILWYHNIHNTLGEAHQEICAEYNARTAGLRTLLE